MTTADSPRTLAGDEFTCSGWACVDCYVLLANGDGPADMTGEEAAEWEARIAENTAGFNITLGLPADEHNCAVNYTVTFRNHGEQTLKVRTFEADDARDALYQFDFSYTDATVISVTAHKLETAEECDCEHDTFSCSPCDVCGSNLGGTRDAVCFWKIITDQAAV